MRPGRPIVVTMSSSREPGTTLLGLSLPTPSYISVALQTIGDLFLVCNHTGTYIHTLFTKVYSYLYKHMNSLNFIDIFKLHLFQGTSGSGRGMHVSSSCVVK
ncbi:hypothetical protein HanPI659440_Chr17g0698651 [Helianthus annuus]|nr:hypothetical protein HanPI659440_Chr17g0698651 [Helianthus annuus]